MSYDSLLIDTSSLIVQTYDLRGDPIEVVTAGIVCRVMKGNKIIRTDTGEEMTSYAKIFYKKTQVIDPKTTRVRLDGEPYDRPIIKISEPQDSVNLHHKEVYVS